MNKGAFIEVLRNQLSVLVKDGSIDRNEKEGLRLNPDTDEERNAKIIQYAITRQGLDELKTHVRWKIATLISIVALISSLIFGAINVTKENRKPIRQNESENSVNADSGTHASGRIAADTVLKENASRDTISVNLK